MTAATGDLGLLVGVDIGGTFTDLISYDTATAEWRSGKVATSAADPAEGVLAGLAEIVKPGERARVSLLCHATTLGINAIIERRGARTALITTEGFTDLLSMGSGQRYDVYELFPAYPEPLVPAELRYGVSERAGPEGTSLVDLGEGEVRRVAGALVADGVESVAICFLHAYLDTAHETEAGKVVSESAPDLPVSLSSAVVPEIREYPRLSTTVANAYILPIVGTYLRRLEDRLRREGYHCELLTMLSAGGMATPETAARFPVRILESGPAGGAVLAEAVTRSLPVDDLLLLDMGGTTAKISVVLDGRTTRAPEFEVARAHRFKAGSGIPIRTPVVDLLEIGAGGGSIAGFDARGLLTVGPESAGADPGPACYGRGGDAATVTDADLALGYLDAERFLGGRLALDAAAADRALSLLGEPLGLDVAEAAWFVHSAVNSSMAGAARVHLAERGLDPAGLCLMAIGGAGPVHAERVAREVGLRSVVIPPDPGVGSAVGLVMAPRQFDASRSRPGRLDSFGSTTIEQIMGELETVARGPVRAAGATDEAIAIARSVDMHLEGQSHELNVPIGEPEGNNWPATIERAFVTAYGEAFGRLPLDRRRHVVTWRVRASAAPAIVAMRAPLRRRLRQGSVAPIAHRSVYFPEPAGFVSTPIYRRDGLQPGDELEGPLIVEEADSATVVGPGARLEILAEGSIWMLLR